MTMKRMAGLLPLVAATMMSACGSGKNESQTADSTAVDVPKVKLETVRIRPVEQTYDFTATVEANVTNNIAPNAGGVRIDRIFVEVGDRVQRGQTLVQMDQTNILQSRIQLENYQIEFDRVDELYKIGGASKSEWDARKTSLDVAKTAYDNLMTNTTLTSPISGTVTARNYDSGDTYNGSTPVLVVEQITPVKVIINVSESFYQYVKKGQDVTLTLDVYGNEIFHGKVNLIYPTVDPQTRTFQVEIQIANTDQRVRPGMFARVTMNFGTIDRVVAPDRSIVKQPGSGERFIYVYHSDGTVSYNPVELGRRMDTEYEVISGVSSGDQVVITGQTRLTNGARVEIDTNTY